MDGQERVVDSTMRYIPQVFVHRRVEKWRRINSKKCEFGTIQTSGRTSCIKHESSANCALG